MKRAELTELLAALPGDTVAALDFPFSVPHDFALAWQPSARAMPPLWEAAAQMEFEEFLSIRDAFCSEKGEPMRRGDLYFPECYSCLHKFNPNMVPMTFRGMQMLHKLWNAGCRVPPLPDDGRNGPLLLESMPGAVINALGLPHKGYKNGQRQQELRQRVLDGLPHRSEVHVVNLGEFRDRCLESHDCLDSLVAAVAAALWLRDPSRFRRPGDTPGRPACQWTPPGIPVRDGHARAASRPPRGLDLRPLLHRRMTAQPSGQNIAVMPAFRYMLAFRYRRLAHLYGHTAVPPPLPSKA